MQGQPEEGKNRSIRELLLRKALHSSGAFILAIQSFFGLQKAQLVILIMVILYVSSEYLRLSGRGLPLFTPVTQTASSQAEQRGIVAAPIWFALGTLISITLFPFRFATIGVLTLTIGDTVASLVGQSIRNRHPYPFNRSKSVEGTLAGFLAAFAVCSFLVDPLTSFVGCLTGMIVEALPVPLNDNFTIPILTSLASLAFRILLG